MGLLVLGEGRVDNLRGRMKVGRGADSVGVGMLTLGEF